jgi:hypothetical protein
MRGGGVRLAYLPVRVTFAYVHVDRGKGDRV